MTAPAERPDLEALTAEVTALRARNEELERAARSRDGGGTTRGGGGRAARVARSVAAPVLIIVGVLCLTLAPPAIWGRNLVLNTDRYVETLAPVAANPGVQSAVISAVDEQVSTHLDVRSLVGQVLPPQAARLLGGPLQSAAESLINTVTTRFVQSPAFQTLWVNVNRIAHQQVTYLLTGNRPANSSLRLNNTGQIVLDLAPIVQQVKDRLVSAGLTVAQNVPTVGATLEIADAHGLVEAQRATRVLNTAADWLPWTGLVLVAGGLIAAHQRRRALIGAALGLAVGMLAIGVGLLIGRNYYLGQIPVDQLPRATAAYLFDTVVRFLRWGIRLVLLVTLLIALGAWVSGPYRTATVVRERVVALPRALGTRLDTGPVGTFVAAYATAVRIGILALMFVIVLLIDSPTLGTVILLAVIAVVLLLVVEMLRAGRHPGRGRQSDQAVIRSAVRPDDGPDTQTTPS
jgi:hypothetical protein